MKAYGIDDRIRFGDNISGKLVAPIELRSGLGTPEAPCSNVHKHGIAEPNHLIL